MKKERKKFRKKEERERGGRQRETQTDPVPVLIHI